MAAPPDAPAADGGRCRHWHGPDDVLLLALPCCGGFWPCRACHDASADHDPQRWPATSDAQALRCGRCQAAQTVAAYLAAPDACPACGGAFNPRCRLHHHLYFEQPGPDQHDS